MTPISKNDLHGAPKNLCQSTQLTDKPCNLTQTQHNFHRDQCLRKPAWVAPNYGARAPFRPFGLMQSA